MGIFRSLKSRASVQGEPEDPAVDQQAEALEEIDPEDIHENWELTWEGADGTCLHYEVIGLFAVDGSESGSWAEFSNLSISHHESAKK